MAMPMQVRKVSPLSNESNVGERNIPLPPDGASNRQLLDWAAVMSVRVGGWVAHTEAHRIAQAYLDEYHRT
jgi:hypothetical protein